MRIQGCFLNLFFCGRREDTASFMNLIAGMSCAGNWQLAQTGSFLEMFTQVSAELMKVTIQPKVLKYYFLQSVPKTSRQLERPDMLWKQGRTKDRNSDKSDSASVIHLGIVQTNEHSYVSIPYCYVPPKLTRTSKHHSISGPTCTGCS